MKHLLPRFTIVILVIISVASLRGQDSTAQDPALVVVNHSFARPSEAVVKHLEIDLTVDFRNKRLAGRVGAYIQNKTGTDKLYLDTRDLIIKRITLDEKGPAATYRLGEPVPFIGRPLIIDILPETKLVNIHYETSPNAAALQWLSPEQTAGKKMPFLFTQSQPILARTWIPCQDNPGIRITYRAKIKTPPGMLALMSAENGTKKSPNGVYEFYMPQPIPSYLLALAVGNLEYRAVSKRCGVYAEPSVVDTAAWEFADADSMIRVAERIYGPYRWGRYDILVLPSSFPFGGMENPKLTFATPTILAGDRSLVSTIAHELAHSWSGNLVTNATWDDFWLNEGFTVYIESRILEAVYGHEFMQMNVLLGYQDLLKTLEKSETDNTDTRLHQNLAGKDPDDGGGDIAYQKGFLFLCLIEETVGRELWDAFLRGYFERFAFQTITTTGFLDYLQGHLVMGDTTLGRKLQIDSWVYGSGLPPNSPVISSSGFQKVNDQLDAWRTGTAAKDLVTLNWTSLQWQHFIRSLPSPLSRKQMDEIDAAFHLSKSHNAQVLQSWFVLAIASNYEPAFASMERYLIEVGRRWLVKPLYEELARSTDGLVLAKKIYAKARPGYHAITAGTIDEILKWKTP